MPSMQTESVRTASGFEVVAAVVVDVVVGKVVVDVVVDGVVDAVVDGIVDVVVEGADVVELFVPSPNKPIS